MLTLETVKRRLRRIATMLRWLKHAQGAIVQIDNTATFGNGQSRSPRLGLYLSHDEPVVVVESTSFSCAGAARRGLIDKDPGLGANNNLDIKHTIQYNWPNHRTTISD